MHCLPVRRNVEVIDCLLDNNRSLIMKQAENRVFAAQAVLKQMLEKNYMTEEVVINSSKESELCNS
jgi:N-succinyl-L-ornithine transcarbamylase